MSHANPDRTRVRETVVRRRFGARGLLLAALIVFTPSVGVAQPCLEWADRTPPPGSRRQHAMTYDSTRGVTVLFGGYDGYYFQGDTLEWDGTTWMRRSTIGPSPRQYHVMAYDSTRGVAVLFGGRDASSSYMGDTWEWNGTTWTLRSTTGPSPRENAAMTYDSARGVTVLFGGDDGFSGYLGDTWEWDGTTWTPRGTIYPPSPRFGHTMAYDNARGVTVLFGGYDGFPSYPGDTWEWDGTTWTLRRRTGPSSQSDSAMAYDSARGVTVLFGSIGLYIGETWEWNGTTWTQRSTTGPSPRYSHAMAYDSTRDVTVLFAGHEGLYYYPFYKRDTWEWDGTAWSLQSTTGPSQRADHAMAYDSARGVTVLFGGNGSGTRGDTWEFAKCVCAPFDGDCDGDRDLGDVAAFQRCFSPGMPAEAECERFDQSGDEGVDLADFAGLMDELTGPMTPPLP